MLQYLHNQMTTHKLLALVVPSAPAEQA
jgi:hypothetical protein